MMRRNYFVMMLAAATFLAQMASGQQAAGLAGKWSMISTNAAGDEVDWTLTVKQDGESWTAMVGSEDGEAPAKEVKVEGKSIHMKTPYHNDLYDVDLKMDGDKLTGKWSGNGDTGPTTGKRL